MPIQVLNETVTDSYEGTEVGLQAQVFGYGTLIVTENPVAVLFFHGRIGGQMAPFEYAYLLPGTYPLFSSERDRIGGLKIKNAVAGQVPAAVVSVFLYEPEQAGLAPSAVINPLAKTGIQEITSNDGSITVVAPFGPVTDLSVNFGAFLHWGTNTDTGNLGLLLDSHRNITIQTTSPGTLTLDGQTGHFTLKDFWVTITTTGGAGQLDIGGINTAFSQTGTFTVNTIQGAEIRSNWVAGSGGPITVDADDVTTISGGKVLISSFKHGALGTLGGIEARLVAGSGNAFYVTDGVNARFQVVDDGTIYGTFDGGTP